MAECASELAARGYNGTQSAFADFDCSQRSSHHGSDRQRIRHPATLRGSTAVLFSLAQFARYYATAAQLDDLQALGVSPLRLLSVRSCRSYTAFSSATS